VGDGLDEESLQRPRLALAGEDRECGVGAAGEQYQERDERKDLTQSCATRVLDRGEVLRFDSEPCGGIAAEQPLATLDRDPVLDLLQRSACAAATPAAGPESRVRTGARVTSAGAMRPPSERITVSALRPTASAIRST